VRDGVRRLRRRRRSQRAGTGGRTDRRAHDGITA
jgi:hypothetical protein